MGGFPATPSKGGSESLPQRVGIVVALFFATLLVFSRATTNGFVNYDDNDYVTANAHVKAGLGIAGIRWALTATEASNWHPLTWISHMTDVSLFGTNPRGHHATSVLLHALNAALAFIVLRQLTRALWPSAISAAWFALDPLRVESVAWIAERKDVLSGTFFFLTLWLYAVYVENRSSGKRGLGWYLASLVAFTFGLSAKPMIVTVPCVLILLDLWPLKRWPSPASAGPHRDGPGWLILEKVPFFVLAALSSWMTYHVQHDSGAVTAALPLEIRLDNAVVSLGRYAGKCLWPSKLAVLYPHHGRLWPAAVTVGAIAFSLVITVLGMVWWRRRPWILIGWFWFVGMLVPVIGIVQVGLQAMADRYTYLPAFGLDVAVVWTVAELCGGRGHRLVLGGAVTLLLIAQMIASVAQIGVWKDSLTLFNHTIAVAGEGNYLAYDNRGIAWGDLGQVDKAITDYRQSLAIRPDYPNANNNLGRVLADRGQLAEAITLYRRALIAAPGMLEVHNNLANALSDAGQIDEAVEHYQYVLQRDPAHRDALNGYAVALATRGRLSEAEQELKKVLELSSTDISALSNLGNVYAIQGRNQEAEACYRQALRLRPEDARTLNNLGNVLLQEGRSAEAADQLARSVALAPINPDGHAALGRALLNLGHRAEAIAQLRMAIAQRPDFPRAKAELGAAMRTNP